MAAAGTTTRDKRAECLVDSSGERHTGDRRELSAVAPGRQRSVVDQLEQSLRSGRVGQVADSRSPDLDAVGQATGLLDARDDDDGRDGRTEQEVIVLSQEENLIVLKAFANPRVRSATPAEGDDVFSGESVSVQAPEQAEGEILVEQNLHDACRTAGGRCAAT